MWILKGRQKIYTDAKEITADNIIKELSKAYEKHKFNRLEMQYLIDFEAGDQPLDRPKIVRPEINNKVTDKNPNGHDLSTGYENIEVYINSLVNNITENQK